MIRICKNRVLEALSVIKSPRSRLEIIFRIRDMLVLCCFMLHFIWTPVSPNTLVFGLCTGTFQVGLPCLDYEKLAVHGKGYFTVALALFLEVLCYSVKATLRKSLLRAQETVEGWWNGADCKYRVCISSVVVSFEVVWELDGFHAFDRWK
jgi:hypothetical protein